MTSEVKAKRNEMRQKAMAGLFASNNNEEKPMKKDKDEELFTQGKLLSGRKNTDLKDFYQAVKKPEKIMPKEPEEVDDFEDYPTASISIKKTVKPVLVNVETGEEFPIDENVYSVGVSKDNDLVIHQEKENHTVSRHHAIVYIINGEVFVKDQSSNGTFVGDNPNDPEAFARLPENKEFKVGYGQYIRFAHVMFKLEG